MEFLSVGFLAFARFGKGAIPLAKSGRNCASAQTAKAITLSGLADGSEVEVCVMGILRGHLMRALPGKIPQPTLELKAAREP